MNIVKLVNIVVLLLIVAACGGGDKEPKEAIVEPLPVITKEPIKNKQFCSEVSCEDTNKVIVAQIYNDVINGLNTGLISSLYAEDFIQHNSAITAGISGQEAYFNTMTADNPNHIATIKHMVADGDYVAVHWHYAKDSDNEFVGLASIDLYKLTDSKIIEHWDVYMKPHTSTVSGNSVFSDLYNYPSNTMANNDVAIEEQNKTMVKAFYLDLFNNSNISLIDELVDSDYIQHNFWVENGSNALKQFVQGGGTEGLSIFLTLGEDDMVWTFSRSVNLATVDLWRVDNNMGKIVEHWDVFLN
jgi:predicted SnoaL-like aldol condensation-catalyzing enzyme